MASWKALGWCGPIAVLAAACTITRSVEPLPRPLDAPLCIQENDEVWSKQLLPALRRAFEDRGVRTTVYRADRPADCRYHATYTAKWRWDMATYLRYADIQVFEQDRLIGRALYDAGGGTANLSKFGSTMDKLDPLIGELLRVQQVAAPSG